MKKIRKPAVWLLLTAILFTCLPFKGAEAKRTDNTKTRVFTAGDQKKLNISNYVKKLNKKAAYTVKSSKTSVLSFSGKATAKNKFRVTMKAKKAGRSKITIVESLNNRKKNVASYTFTVKKETNPAVEKLLETPLEDILEQIFEGVDAELPKRWNQEITKENSSYYLGIDQMEFEEALASEAMINAVPFSVCLVKLKKGEDVEAIKKEISRNVDPQKWICVGVDPENVLVDNIDRLILLVMTNDGAQEIMDSFLSLMDGKAAARAAAAVSNPLVHKGGYYSRALSSYNEKSVKNLAKKIDGITKKYLKKSKNIFYSIIPDKGYYIKNKYFTSKDYSTLFQTMQRNVKTADYISIVKTLRLSDYFKTDLHWKQEKLIDAANALGKKMKFEISEKSFRKNTKKPYQGVYAPFIKNPAKETLTYLTSAYTRRSSVEIYGTKGTTPVYNLSKWDSEVPYDIFLSGPNPLITIKNSKTDSKRKLLLFGDSFANSLAPLLLEAYCEITLIDLRFVSSRYLDQFVSFSGQDALFLYNAAVINNSFMLK